jgi:hypothetical protein
MTKREKNLMLNWILGLPFWAGALVAGVLTVTGGLLMYWVSYRLVTRYQREDLGRATSSLFVVIGILVSLVLTLNFDDVVQEWGDAQNAIKSEVAGISDTLGALDQYGPAETAEARSALLDYTQSVIDDDWPALADDELSEQTDELFQQGVRVVFALDPTDSFQKELRTRTLDDLDAISDDRQGRLNAAIGTTPAYSLVILLGLLITIAFFGVYRPQPPLVAFLILYTAFVGLMLYLILALSDPFQGGIGLDPTLYENLLAEQSGG